MLIVFVWINTFYLWTVAFCPHGRLVMTISLLIFLFLVNVFPFLCFGVLRGALRF